MHQCTHIKMAGLWLIGSFVRAFLCSWVRSFSSWLFVVCLVGCYIKLLGVVIKINRSMRGSGIGRFGVVQSPAMFRVLRCSEFGVVQSTASFGVRRCSDFGVVQSSALFKVRRCSELCVVQRLALFSTHNMHTIHTCTHTSTNTYAPTHMHKHTHTL